MVKDLANGCPPVLNLKVRHIYHMLPFAGRGSLFLAIQASASISSYSRYQGTTECRTRYAIQQGYRII